MNKKGFTIIELLAVIVIIAIITTIASVGIGSIKNAINKNLLETKKDVVIAGAKLYGQDNRVLLTETNNIGSNTYSKSLLRTVHQLRDYIDLTEDCVDKDNKKYKCIKSDVNGKSLNGARVLIYEENNRVYATFFNEEDFN